MEDDDQRETENYGGLHRQVVRININRESLTQNGDGEFLLFG